MKTWNNYKKEYAERSDENAQEIAYVEAVTEFIGMIIKAREEKGLSQTELAEICGLKQSAISRLESLKSSPQLDTVIKVLQPLGLKMAVLPSLA